MKPLREERRKNRPCLFRRRTAGNPCDDRNRRRPFQRRLGGRYRQTGIHATLNGVAQINKPFVFSSEGIFKGELTPGTGAWTYLAYYPHGEQSLNGTSATIPFGNTRIQKGGTYNSLFDILIAPAQTTANSAEGVDDSGERIRFNMQRLTSILDFDLTNSTSDPIRCVLLTAESDDFLSAKS